MTTVTAPCEKLGPYSAAEATYILTNLHCLHCGARSLWKDESRDDYYAGTYHLCSSCGYYYYLNDDIRKPEPWSTAAADVLRKHLT